MCDKCGLELVFSRGSPRSHPWSLSNGLDVSTFPRVVPPPFSIPDQTGQVLARSVQMTSKTPPGRAPKTSGTQRLSNPDAYKRGSPCPPVSRSSYPKWSDIRHCPGLRRSPARRPATGDQHPPLSDTSPRPPKPPYPDSLRVGRDIQLGAISMRHQRWNHDRRLLDLRLGRRGRRQVVDGEPGRVTRSGDRGRLVSRLLGVDVPRLRP